jgi:hypothetical protein
MSLRWSRVTPHPGHWAAWTAGSRDPDCGFRINRKNFIGLYELWAGKEREGWELLGHFLMKSRAQAKAERHLARLARGNAWW